MNCLTLTRLLELNFAAYSFEPLRALPINAFTYLALEGKVAQGLFQANQ